MPWTELTDINGDLDEFEYEFDGLGRRRFTTGRGRRHGRRAARRARRAARRGVGPGRVETVARTYRLPDGRLVCPGPSDLILISDEPQYDSIYQLDLSAWGPDQTFFDVRRRTPQTVARTSLLEPTRVNYDMDIESIGVAFHCIDAGSAAINADQQTLLEIVARGVLEYNVQQKDNRVFPVSDCPAGSGTWRECNTTQNNMRTLGIQNGDPSKGRRKLNAVIPVRKATSFVVTTHMSQEDEALLAGLTNDPTRGLQVRVALYGPEGVPLVPSGAGALTQPQGIMMAQ
jgi:hypothetical protein